MPDLYGLSEEQVNKMSEMSMQSLKGIRGASFMLGVSRGSEPMYSKFIGVMQVENSQAFMANYEKYLQQYGELIKDAHRAILQPMTVEKTEIGGVAGLQITMNVPQPPGGARCRSKRKLWRRYWGQAERSKPGWRPLMSTTLRWVM